jgi:uncharacterized BrkB/YihY/UPF0761 family membrane protein
MKKINIKIDGYTLIFASITIILTLVNNLYLRIKFPQIMNLSPPNIENWIKSYWLFTTLPLILCLSILPILWAWQNYSIYRKKWLYLVAIGSIILGIQSLVAITVFVIYLVNLWQEFQKEKNKNV